MIRRLIPLFFSVLGCLYGVSAYGQTIRQVYLVQNSGWMEPYFLDPNSQFTALAEYLVRATELEGAEITVAAFNQNGQIPNRVSPEVVFKGSYSEQAVRESVSRIDLPRRPNGRYADADFLGTLQSTIADLLHGEDGIIWMLSNNKNSPDNDQNIAENTRGFYDLLRRSEYVTRIVAFPLRMQVSGPNFSEKGFIVYGIAYGENAAQALDVLTAKSTPLRELFADPPIFLKPSEPQVLELEFSPQTLSADTTISMQDGVVVLDGIAGGSGSLVEFTAKIRNIAYPKKIVSARVSTEWSGYEDGPAITTDQPPEIRDLATGATSDPITLTLRVPPTERPPGFLGYFQTQLIVDGFLDIMLNDLSFDLDDNFVEKATAVFGGEMIGEGQRSFLEQQLPSIFYAFRDVETSVTRVPIRMNIQFSAWPIYLAAAVGVALAAALIALPLLLLKARLYTVTLGGSAHKLFLRPGQKVEVSSADGTRHLVTGRIFGRPNIAPQQ